MTRLVIALALALCAAPASAQLPSIPHMDKVLKGAQVLESLTITADEERQIGAMVSERIRRRYGVMQDAAVHRYVALVGTVVAQAGAPAGAAAVPNWQFIVLDTDGVNAFAAPGGYVHVTRGALGLMRSEAELAGVLGHEILHVTGQHTIKAIQKGKVADLGIEAGNARAPGGGLSRAALTTLADRAADLVLAGFGRAEELESDEKGLALSNKAGYAPGGLGAFLLRLDERNAGATQRQGLFASHPETKERLDRLARLSAGLRPPGTATLEARYKSAITFDAKPQAEIPQVEGGAAGLTGGASSTPAPAAGKPSDKKDEKASAEAPKKKGLFGVSQKLFSPSEEKKSAQVTGSGGSRGVDTERNAAGGANPAPVAVTLTAADLQQFKTEGQLS